MPLRRGPSVTTDPHPSISDNDLALLRDALRRGAGRRKLLAWLGAGGLAAAAAGAVLTRAGEALAQTPRRGGRIRVAGQSHSTADTVDPAKQSFSIDYARCTMFYNGLTVLDQSLTPQPELAETLETSDATVWHIKLRRDVRFHDGSPLTAADVAYSLSRHKDPATGSVARALASQMQTIEAVGPSEVRVTLSSPNADFPVVLGTFHFLIIKDGTRDFTTANGTGPYRVKEFTPGVRTIGVRNEDYWRSGGAHLDEIELFGIPDENARINALLSGDVHLIAAVSPRLTRRIANTPGYAVFETRSGNYNNLVMRQDADPSRNPDLVMAIKYLFNREQMRATVMQGHAVVANDHPIDPTNRFFCRDIPQRPYDPERAKFHLQRSGLANTPIPVHAMAGSAMVDIAVLLQQAGQAIGLNLDIRRMPPDGYWSNVWTKQPLSFGNINPRPSADVLFTLFYKSDSPWNESGWKNERFDQLLIAARGETDEAKRRQMYCEMQELARDVASVAIPMFNSFLDAHSTKVKGLRPVPLGGLMGYNFAERIWLEA